MGIILGSIRTTAPFPAVKHKYGKEEQSLKTKGNKGRIVDKVVAFCVRGITYSNHKDRAEDYPNEEGHQEEPLDLVHFHVEMQLLGKLCV